ncbi:WD40 repeat-like protein [Rhizopus microsporus var. microsporus]|uniref:WD40 repeat-like protein n=2 Tax=Rhizopus microsporus TaxID=58291 RepID=A0A2G4SSI3_RHIZD|nr:WD40 repeat-like protein [Rhizopus microsporus ATCC 52813]ORE07015.1 WD40 repeat-like protein [Rhizopus microsporus var. microsporus]PHZ11729.1 WD40 repeat-like protein [Rhizopus microsporus ATCC 52813]
MVHVNKKLKKDDSEQQLEDLLFGDNTEDLWSKTGQELEQEEDDEVDDTEVNDEEDINEATFFFDSGPFTGNNDDEVDYEAEQQTQQEDTSDEESDEDTDSDEDRYALTKAAWVDDDDKKLQISLKAANMTKKLRNDIDEDVIDGAEYTRRLRRQFNRLHPKPDWARLPSETKSESRKRKADDSSDEEEAEADDQLDEETRIDLLKSTMGILNKRSNLKAIPPKRLDIMRLKDANRASLSQRGITCISFHPNAQVMLVGGLDKVLRLFQIDGKINPKIQSVKFKDMPIYHAEFHPSGDEIVVSGRRSYFYIYNIQTGIIDRCPGIWGREEKSLEEFSISPCGRYIAFLGVSGVIIVVSYSTKKWYCNLKVNKTVESVSWSSDGNYLFGFSGEGQVYQFDVQNKECMKRWNDEGCIGPSVIRVSPDERYYATGSSTGIVNVYDRSVLEPESINPKPFKVIESLTTRVNNILFNHDSQLMVISSQSKKEQLRVIHVPTGTAYANWPTDGTPLNTVKCVAFSPNSDYLAIANKKGKVLLYTLKHYALKD